MWRLNGWTNWAEIFCGHSLVAWGVIGQNKKKFSKFVSLIFSRAIPGPSASIISNKTRYNGLNFFVDTHGSTGSVIVNIF